MPFAPTDIAGLHAWWKADSLALADNDPVGTWTDSGSNGYNGTQGTAGAKPTYKTGIVNSLPIVQFDGGDGLNTSASSSLPAQSLFAVVRHTGGGGSQSILPGGYSTLQWRLVTSKQNVLRSGVVDVGTSTTTLSSVNFQVVTLTWANATAYAFYYNGTADGTAATGETLPGGGVMAIGGTYEAFVGDIAEIIMYDSVLSTTNRDSVTGYLGTKYAITVAVSAPALPIIVQPPRRS